jgi:hypothetical protein
VVVVGPWDGSGDPTEQLIVCGVRSFRRWRLWLFVVCGVMILRVRRIGLVFAGRIVCVVGVNGSRVGRVFVVGGHTDVVRGMSCGAGCLCVCRAVGGVFLVIR